MQQNQTACFMWQLVNNGIPRSISGHFNIRNKTFGEKGFKHYIPFAKSDLMKRNIMRQGPRL